MSLRQRFRQWSRYRRLRRVIRQWQRRNEEFMIEIERPETVDAPGETP